MERLLTKDSQGNFLSDLPGTQIIMVWIFHFNKVSVPCNRYCFRGVGEDGTTTSAHLPHARVYTNLNETFYNDIGESCQVQGTVSLLHSFYNFYK